MLWSAEILTMQIASYKKSGRLRSLAVFWCIFWVGKKRAELQLEDQEFGTFQSLPVECAKYGTITRDICLSGTKEMRSFSLFLALRLGYDSTYLRALFVLILKDLQKWGLHQLYKTVMVWRVAVFKCSLNGDWRQKIPPIPDHTPGEFCCYR